MLSFVQDFNRSGYERCVEIYPKINEFCQDLFINTKFKKFAGGRFFLDELNKANKLSYFSTDLPSTKWFAMDVAKNGCAYTQAVVQIPPDQLGYFIHPQHTNDHLLNAYGEQFNFCNGMTIYDRKGKYINAWEVFMSTSDACSYTINKSFIEYFSKWICYFTDSFPTLLETETIHLIETIDLSFAPLNFFDTALSQKALIKEKLSRQEFNCFTLCGLGKTMKEIAKDLGLSPRTIEGYLRSIKNKLGISFKSDIMKFAQEITSSNDIFKHRNY